MTAIEISLYGATEATYEAVTRVKGSYRRCLRGIERIVARRLPLKLKTPVLTLNRHELDDIAAIAERHGVAFRYDPAKGGESRSSWGNKKRGGPRCASAPRE